MLKKIKQEDEQITPYEESIEVINLGDNEDDRKEVRIGTALMPITREELISLL